MHTCNVIGNTAKSYIIYVWRSLNISNSCLIENTKKMFFVQSIGNICTIINCTIDNTDNDNYDTKESVIVDSNNIPPESFINNLDNNECFTMNMPIDYAVCPTFNLRQYKYQINKYRGILIFAQF